VCARACVRVCVCVCVLNADTHTRTVGTHMHMHTQGLQQQRGMGGMGGPGMGSMGGMHSMGGQLGGRPLGMQGTNLSALGMGGRAPTQVCMRVFVCVRVSI
jgi:hypothetical protein